MERMSLTFICALALLSCVVANEDSEIESRKVAVVKVSSLLAASAVRKINLKDPQSKVQISSMASDFMIALNYAKYALGSVIPNIPDDDNSKEIDSAFKKISSIGHDIQHAFAGDPEALKEKLATTLEEINQSVTAFEQKYKGGSNSFLDNQLKRKYDVIIYAIYKLQVQATHFDLTNKQLEPLIDSGLEKIIDVVKSLSVLRKTTQSELLHIFQHLSLLTERNVYKLENWMELNSESKELVKLVQEASKTLGRIYEKIVTVSTGRHTAVFLKLQLISVIESFKQAKLLAAIVYPDNLGGHEFIRSLLFDCIAMGKVYSENVKVLA